MPILTFSMKIPNMVLLHSAYILKFSLYSPYMHRREYSCSMQSIAEIPSTRLPTARNKDVKFVSELLRQFDGGGGN